MSHALTLSIPAVGSLDHYIQAVSQFPMLTQEEEQRLGQRLQHEQDVEAARQLVLSHLRLVVSIARGYVGYGLPQADLIQEGNVGLMKAVKRFDPERGVRLVSFAVHWIKAEIHEFILRNWRLVKVATTKGQRKLFFNLRSLKQSLGTLGPQEVQQMATQLGVRPEEVREMEMRMSGQELALEPGDQDDSAWAPIDYLADCDSEPTAQLEKRRTEHLQGDGLQTALQQLDPRSRRIVEARWLADEGEAATLHEMAAEFGVSAERIRQIEAKALQKMRGVLAAA